jgi:3'-phosphoadenosine 5'-phosphosulfate sulfotransferase (PAPS reductase)/FAD synthetase
MPPQLTLFAEPEPVVPDLADYHWIVVNSSAGKDSQAMLDYVAAHAAEADALPRVVVVHCDLGRVEWPGTRELAEEQARHYGVRFEVVSRVHKQGDLLRQIEQRGMFPDSQNRYCTSDQKRGQVMTLLTRLTNEFRGAKFSPLRCRILNCLGLRADESPARAKKQPFIREGYGSNGRRRVDHWLPLHTWNGRQVWDRIRESGLRHHYAYDLGMPRLSCCFCIFSPRPALLLAGKHNPELLAEYVRVEEKIGHTLRVDQSLAEVQRALTRGEQPAGLADWVM